MAYKCCICKQSIGNDEAKSPYKGKFAHTNCFNEEIKKISDSKRLEQAQKQAERNKKSKKKNAPDVVVIKETTIAKSELEAQDEKRFREFITELTGDKPKAQHIALAKKYTKEYKVKHSDIVMALKYWFIVMKNELDEGMNLIGVFPYAYEKAKQYYAEIDYAQEENNKLNLNNFYMQNEIHISKPVQKQMTQIDLNLIGV